MNNCSVLCQAQAPNDGTTVLAFWHTLTAMTKRPRTSDTVVANLKMLLEKWPMSIPELAHESGVTERMIRYILDRERNCSPAIADKLAQPFGITGWLLLFPGLRFDLVKNGKITEVIDLYAKAPAHSRHYVHLTLVRDVTAAQGANDEDPDTDPPAAGGDDTDSDHHAADHRKRLANRRGRKK